jgi:hypothetical protein
MFIRFCFGSWVWGRSLVISRGSLAVSRWSLARTRANVDPPAQERKGRRLPSGDLTDVYSFVLEVGSAGVSIAALSDIRAAAGVPQPKLRTSR